MFQPVSTESRFDRQQGRDTLEIGVGAARPAHPVGYAVAVNHLDEIAASVAARVITVTAHDTMALVNRFPR